MSVSLRSSNFPDRFIRHQNFLGELTPVVSDLDKADATFSSINDFRPETVAQIRPSNFSTMCLRHQDFRIKLHEFNPPIFGPNSRPETSAEKLLREDCTFTVRRGLADPAGVSFESVNFPGRFIRHRDFHLFLEPADSDLARRDATFIVVSPFIPDLPGPH
ncbi:AbfB domain-containing protein [Bradyrhizobium centrolobii]|uniref:AbfB domain-containing protein n=1 Tax=Bradyrhizobium centrolobii TaxID=1505087 RepID=UPI0009ED166C|nr:AbfB domain-containing protein [Bradyrhizobium centrolobii]